MKTKDASSLLQSMLSSDGMRKFIETYNVAASALLAVSTLAVIIMIILHIVRLAKSGDNPRERQEAISGLIVCLISFSVLGGIDTVYLFVVSSMFQ